MEQGAHDAPRLRATPRPPQTQNPASRGVGPKSPTTGTPSAPARCRGPVSPATTTEQRASDAQRSSSGVSPSRAQRAWAPTTERATAASASDASTTLPTDDDAEVPPRDSAPYLLPRHLYQDAKAYTEAQGIKFGHFVAPIRAALTGTDKGPGLFDIVWLLGKETAVQRLRRFAK